MTYSPTTTQAAGVLQAGIATLSQNQQVTFTQYTRTTVSDDGYVFWVKTATTQTFTGSLHYSTETTQEEDQTIGVNDVVFTSESEITELNAISPTTLWIASYPTDGGTLQIAFSGRALLYLQAGIWHYHGIAVYPALQAQLIASSADLPTGPIVSNSLPIWLTLGQGYAVYPSFLVPDNIVPPYISVHIEPGKTAPLGQFPMLVPPGVSQQPGNPAAFYNWPSSQLLRDQVRFTFYGFTSQQAVQFLVGLIEQSLNTDDFGFCNSPVFQDEKRAQSEITAIAQKKTLELSASYYLNTADAYARRYILSAAVTTTT